jgi:hypothetical protein
LAKFSESSKLERKHGGRREWFSIPTNLLKEGNKQYNNPRPPVVTEEKGSSTKKYNKHNK